METFFAIIRMNDSLFLKCIDRSGASEKPKVNVWTLPILLKSPLGMLTLADVVFIFVNLFVVVFYFTKSMVDKREIDEMIMFPGIPPK